MAYTAPTTRTTGYVVTASNWNTDLVDNIAWIAGARPAVLALETTNQSIAVSGTSTALAFNDTDLYDTQGQHDTTTNTSRITCGAGNTGLYHFHASGLWASNATGVRFAFLRLNGSTELYRVTLPSVTATVTGWQVSGYYRFTAAADYMEVLVNQTSGGALDIANSTVSAKFGATWLGV